MATGVLRICGKNIMETGISQFRSQKRFGKIKAFKILPGMLQFDFER